MTDPGVPPSEPHRPAARSTPKKTGRGSRFLVAGAAVGLSIAAVGGMSAASQAGDSTQPPVSTVQRVVVQDAVLPQQIVIILPDTQSAGSRQTLTPQSIQITTPGRATAPAQSPVTTKHSTPTKATTAATPVTESGGS